MRMLAAILLSLAALTVLAFGGGAALADQEKTRMFSVHPIGYVRKAEGKTRIVLDKAYQPGLLGLERLEEIWVLWWFDKNDTPEKRAILQVHPRANPANPLTGVFATRAPLRPNLIALTKCRVVAVRDNVIEIESIDAFAGTPVLDIKRVIEAAD